MSRTIVGPTVIVAVVAACSSNSTPTAPLTVTGYTLAITTPVHTDSVTVGDSILVAFKVTANESDGSSRPAEGESVNVNVTAGGGTVTSPGSGLSGGTGADVSTGADGTASIVWVIGPAAGIQSLQVAASNTEVFGLDLNVSSNNSTQPGLRLTSRSGGAGAN